MESPALLTDNPAARLTEHIRSFCRSSPLNTISGSPGDPLFREPLVGFSHGADPLYGFLKKDIGSPIMTPVEAFRKAFPGTDARAEDLTVISWVLPHNPATIRENAGRNFLPSRRWVLAKHGSPAFSKELSRYLIDLLRETGHQATAPQYEPFFSVKMSKKYGLTSIWSERHAAYVSGLGTFGLCDGLITPAGKAVWCGSVIARIAIPPTERLSTDHHANCLYYAKGTCRKCISRCPAKAVSDNGHNKLRCFLYGFLFTRLYILLRYRFNEYGCAMCQTGVPCDARNPVRNR